MPNLHPTSLLPKGGTQVLESEKHDIDPTSPKRQVVTAAWTAGARHSSSDHFYMDALYSFCTHCTTFESSCQTSDPASPWFLHEN